MMMTNTSAWKSAAQKLMIQNPSGFKTLQSFNALLDFIHKNDWQGACHGSSAVFATLLVAQGLKPTLCLGEVFSSDGSYFDHSWVELGGEIYDAAISKTLNHEVAFPPVYRGIDLTTKEPTLLTYGKPSGQGYNASASLIRTTNVAEYMKNFPDHRDGLCGIAKTLAKGMNPRITLQSLKDSAMKLKWTERP